MTAVCALGAVLWHLSATSKAPALATAASVERGDTITAGDLRVVYVASDGPLERLDEGETARVVGRVAAVDLPAGSLVTPAVLAEASTPGEGDGVVGLALEPGQYPTVGLAQGDRVNVVRSAAEGAAEGDEDAVVARGATVFAVEELASDRMLVSVMAAAADAETVAAGAGSGTLRLVLVP